ncbi:MAG: hypothetical protein JXA07_02420 [Spirochaetes bacterium]|nr:hypothetical protein [Spirochaetota bacterium]
MSQVHYESIGLERLIALSPIIALVRATVDGFRERSFQPPCDIAPYTYTETGFRVVRILRGPATIKAGSALSVTGFDPTALKCHIDFLSRGLARSPVMESYEPEHAVAHDPEAELIIFLARRIFLVRDTAGKLKVKVDMPARTCPGAMESPKTMKRVIRLIKAHPAMSRLEIVIGCSPPLPDGADTQISDRLKSMFPGYNSYSWKMLNISPGSC